MSQTLYEMIKEEDDLTHQRDILDCKIASELYIAKESHDEKQKQEAMITVAKLKDQNRIVEGKLEDIRSSLKIRIFNLLQHY